MPCFSHKKSTKRSNDFCTTPADTTNVTTIVQEESGERSTSYGNKKPCTSIGNDLPYKWEPSPKMEPTKAYVKRLETQYAEMERNMFIMNANFARMHCRLRQIAQAYPCDCNDLLKAIEYIMLDSIRTSNGTSTADELPAFLEDIWAFGDAKVKQIKIISSIRSRLGDLRVASEALKQDDNLTKVQEMGQVSQFEQAQEAAVAVTDLREICKQLQSNEGLLTPTQSDLHISTTPSPTLNLCCALRVKGFKDAPKR